MMSKEQRTEHAAADWLARLDKTSGVPEPGDAVLAYSGIDADFASWVNSSLEHRLAFLRLYTAWWRANRLSVLAPGTALPQAGNRWWPRVSLAAAACLLMGVFVAVMQHRSLQVWQVHETAVGQQQIVALPDGSRVELNTNARMTSRFSGGLRSVVLERGEAYFDVAKDRMRPFMVEAGDNRIIVLGTQFSVRRREEDLKVLVAEGKVRIESRLEDPALQPIVATRGSLVIARGDAAMIEHKSEAELTAELGWRRGLLIFEQKDLASIASEFNRYNRLQLLPGDAETAATLIGGSFKITNVETFVRLLESDFGFRTERRGDTILIKKASVE